MPQEPVFPVPEPVYDSEEQTQPPPPQQSAEKKKANTPVAIRMSDQVKRTFAEYSARHPGVTQSDLIAGLLKQANEAELRETQSSNIIPVENLEACLGEIAGIVSRMAQDFQLRQSQLQAERDDAIQRSTELNADLKQTVADLKKQASDLQEQLAASQRENGKMHQECVDLQQNIDKLNADLAEQRTAYNQLNLLLRDRLQEADDRMAAAVSLAEETRSKVSAADKLVEAAEKAAKNRVSAAESRAAAAESRAAVAEATAAAWQAMVMSMSDRQEKNRINETRPDQDTQDNVSES